MVAIWSYREGYSVFEYNFKMFSKMLHNKFIIFNILFSNILNIIKESN